LELSIYSEEYQELLDLTEKIEQFEANRSDDRTQWLRQILIAISHTLARLK